MAMEIIGEEMASNRKSRNWAGSTMMGSTS
eukprot:jgi/Botrbrau1/9989/Bobra.0012s0078.1